MPTRYHQAGCSACLSHRIRSINIRALGIQEHMSSFPTKNRYLLTLSMVEV